MQSSRIRLTITPYIQLLSKESLPTAYTTSIVENLLFTINLLIAIGTKYNKRLLNLANIYIDNVKYSSYNDSFTFKLTISYNICFRTDILSKIKMKVFFTILKSPILNNYSSNIGISSTVINSD